MFQVGSGERFKYKTEVKKIYPNAVCKKVTVNGYLGGTIFYSSLYAVHDNGKRISGAFRSAEGAWSDVWCKLENEKR